MSTEYPNGDVVLQKTPYSFDVSVWEFLLPLISGSKLVLASPEGHRDPNYLAELIEKEQVTTLHFVPSMLSLFLTADVWNRCKSVNQVICSGEALPVELRSLFFEVTEDCRLHNLYGPTEAAIDVSFWDCGDESKELTVPIGKPIQNISLYILDDKQRHVPIGVAGELCISGVGLSRGYLNRDALTAEKFIPNPYANQAAGSERLYRTGDLARYTTGGNLVFLGRIDDQVKLRGYRIELGEIEHYLRKQGGIRDAAVVVSKPNTESAQLVAYVVRENASRSSDTFDQELTIALSNELPAYMVPDLVQVVDNLPLSSNGKVNRKELAARDIEIALGEEKVLPRNSTEIELKHIWEDVFEIEMIGMRDDFFDLGGNSFHAITLISRIEAHFSKRLKLEDLLHNTTIEKVAGLINGEQLESEPSHLVFIQPKGEKPPLFCVHPAGGHVYRFVDLANRLGKNQPVIGIRSHGFDDNLMPYATYEEAAEAYIKAIRAHQPEGPYHIVGMSCGGCIAYEMACQLKQEGESIQLIGLFDTFEPSQLANTIGEEQDPEMSDHDPAVALAGMFAAYISGDPKEFMAMDRETRLDTVIDKIKAANRLPVGYGKEELLRLVETRRIILSGMMKYKPKTFTDRVDMFLASEGNILDWKTETLGWDRFAENIHIHHVPGPHDRITQEPAVAVLAEAVRSCLV